MRGRDKVMIFRVYENLENEYQNVYARQVCGEASKSDLSRMKKLENQKDAVTMVMDALNITSEYPIWQENKGTDMYMKYQGREKGDTENYG